MPTVSVNKSLLYKSLGRQFTDKEFDELCFQFGIEVDDIVEDPEKGTTLKIDIGANRYDLLCLEGISRALNIFCGTIPSPEYQLLPAECKIKNRLIIKPATGQVRAYAVGAILRNMHFTKDIYNSFIELQDKLHQNLARKRTLVAIGTHDLDTIEGPFIYDAVAPQDITFVPLNQSKEFRGDELMDFLSSDLHLKEYLPIIKDKPVYPVIKDRNGVVLSLPPIINGDHSKITLDTKNVFVECTGTDKFKTQVVLDTIVCMMSEHCKKPFTVEAVEVEYPDGEVTTFPKLETRRLHISVDRCNTLNGLSESPSQVAKLLAKMSLKASPSKTKNFIDVEVPPTRYDILHECDVVEDVGIAYGYDLIAKDKMMPPTNTIGREFELNYFSDKLRLLLSQNNYTEAATFTLCSMADIGEKLRLNLKDQNWVKVGNPKTTECEAVRNSLLPGILKTLTSNKHIALPIKLFEVGDVCVRDPNPETTLGVGARNERHLCAVKYDGRVGMDTVHGLLDEIMTAIKIPFDEQKQKTGYCLIKEDHPSYLPGRCAVVMVKGTAVGRLGILHPEVYTNFALNNAAEALILNVQQLLQLSKL